MFMIAGFMLVSLITLLTLKLEKNSQNEIVEEQLRCRVNSCLKRKPIKISGKLVRNQIAFL